MSKDKVRDLLRTNPKYISIFIYIYDENGDNKSVLFYDSKKNITVNVNDKPNVKQAKSGKLGGKKISNI